MVIFKAASPADFIEEERSQCQCEADQERPHGAANEKWIYAKQDAEDEHDDVALILSIDKIPRAKCAKNYAPKKCVAKVHGIEFWKNSRRAISPSTHDFNGVASKVFRLWDAADDGVIPALGVGGNTSQGAT